MTDHDILSRAINILNRQGYQGSRAADLVAMVKSGIAPAPPPPSDSVEVRIAVAVGTFNVIGCCSIDAVDDECDAMSKAFEQCSDSDHAVSHSAIITARVPRRQIPVVTGTAEEVAP